MEYLPIVLSVFGLLVSIIALIQTHKFNKFTKNIEQERRQDEKEKKDKDKINNRPQFKIVSYSKNLENPGYVKDDSFNYDVLFIPYKSMSCDVENYSPLYKTDNKTGKQSFKINGKKGYPKKPICEYADIYNFPRSP